LSSLMRRDIPSEPRLAWVFPRFTFIIVRP
jgi:hypothetical protein